MLVVLILMFPSRQAFSPGHGVLSSPVPPPLRVAQRPGQCSGRATRRMRLPDVSLGRGSAVLCRMLAGAERRWEGLRGWAMIYSNAKKGKYR